MSFSIKEDSSPSSKSPDVVLVSEDGERVQCHHSVLSKSSPYFEAMFGSQFRERDQKAVVIKDVNGLSLRKLVDSVYGVPLRLDYEAAFQLTAPAAMLQFNAALDACCSLLSRNITTEKCVEIFTLADLLCLSNLRKQALSFILYNFSRIAGETHVLSKASRDVLVTLLSNPSLCCRDEVEVFECLASWLDDNTRNPEDADDKWPHLIQCLKFSSMEIDDLRSLSCFPTVQDSPFLRPLVSCILSIKERKPVAVCRCSCHGNTNGCSNTSVCDECRRNCLAAPSDTREAVESQPHSSVLCCLIPCDDEQEEKGAFLLTKQDEEPKDERKFYEEDIVRLAKELLEKGPRALCLFPCVVSHIRTKQKEQNAEDAESLHPRVRDSGKEPVILTFDPERRKLELFLKLDKANQGPTEATGYKLCVLGKDIFLVGGEYMLGYSNWQKSVWRYDASTCTWSVETTLPQPRRHHSLCVMDQYIYVIGGFGRYRIILDSVDRYDTVNCQWRKCASLPSAVYSSACCSYNGVVYVFGSQVFAYYPSQDHWESIRDLSMPSDVIFTSAMATVKHGIYLTGSTSRFLYWVDFGETPPQLHLVGSFENVVLNSCLDPSKNRIYSFTTSSENNTVEERHLIEIYNIQNGTFETVWQSSDKSEVAIEDLCPQYSLGCFPLIQFS